MSEQKWEVGPVKLVNGTDGHIDFVHNRGKSVVYTGRFKTCDGDWWAIHWDASGRVPNSCDGYGHNLAPLPKKTMRVRGWLNIHSDGRFILWSDKFMADSVANRFACVEIDCEVTEGEGLSETPN